MTERLSREDWLRFALKTLATSGHGALKADTLARALGVSRGSFYWHFADLAAFHTALLEHWRSRYSEGIIEALAAERTPRAKLTKLLERSMGGDPSLERALRAWAVADDAVRHVIDETDVVRLTYVEALLREHGVASNDVALRARIAYWAYLGQAMLSERPSPSMCAHAASEITAMAMRR